MGQVWAYRERVNDVGSPLLRADVLQLGPKGSNKARVRIDGGEFPGLDQWVSRRRLLVPWDEAAAWAEDERRLDALGPAACPREDVTTTPSSGRLKRTPVPAA